MAVEADWDDIDDASGVIPEGRYLCRLVEVNEKLTRDGDEFWRLTWQVEEGPQADNEFNDSLFFSKKALPRAKLLFESLGLILKGRVRVEPKHTEGRQAWVQVEHREWKRDDGSTGTGVNVPFAGYGRCTDQEEKVLTPVAAAPETAKEPDYVEEVDDSEIPF